MQSTSAVNSTFDQYRKRQLEQNPVQSAVALTHTFPLVSMSIVLRFLFLKLKMYKITEDVCRAVPCYVSIQCYPLHLKTASRERPLNHSDLVSVVDQVMVDQ